MKKTNEYCKEFLKILEAYKSAEFEWDKFVWTGSDKLFPYMFFGNPAKESRSRLLKEGRGLNQQAANKWQVCAFSSPAQILGDGLLT